MKRALVTGAGGFIGHNLVKFLKGEGYYVKGIDIKRPEFERTKADEFMELDLRGERNCRMAVAGVFDEIYHLTANMGGIGYITEKKAEIMRDNMLMDINMLEATRFWQEEEHKRIKFFFSSSACVYPIDLQQQETNIISLKEEDAYPANCEEGYGWAKLFTEQLCHHYWKEFKIPTYIARLHNIYGEYGTYDGGREKAPAALCRKIAKAENNGEIEIWGDGKQTRSFCYIDDCVEAIHKLVQSDYHDPINIGSDRKININELIDIIEKVADKKVIRKYNSNKPQGVRNRNADISLAKKVLDWQPKITLEEGLERTYKWIEEQIK